MTAQDQKIAALMAQEENLLIAAIARTMKAYNDSSTIANLKDWKGAKKALEEYRQKKQAEANPEEARFKNLMQALEYLQTQGWKISRGKFYQDENLIKKEKDGSITKAAMDKYAEQFLKKLDGSDAEESSIAEKMKWETEIAKQKAEQLTRQNEVETGMYILRSDVEQLLAGRAALLKADMESFFYTFAPKFVELAAGDANKTPDLIAFCLSEMEQWLHRYAEKMEFMAPVVNTHIQT